MATQLTADDAKQSLTAHVASKGAEIFAKYGPRIGWNELQAILSDRSCVRYPCTLDYDESGLQPGEFAYAEPNGELPENGFTLHVHPIYSMRPATVNSTTSPCAPWPTRSRARSNRPKDSRRVTRRDAPAGAEPTAKAATPCPARVRSCAALCRPPRPREGRPQGPGMK